MQCPSINTVPLRVSSESKIAEGKGSMHEKLTKRVSAGQRQ